MGRGMNVEKRGKTKDFETLENGQMSVFSPMVKIHTHPAIVKLLSTVGIEYGIEKESS